MTKRLKQKFKIIYSDGNLRTITLTGQTARTLSALINNKSSGVTAQGLSSWALRLSEYIRILRHDYHLSITMTREQHDGVAGKGWHGLYILQTHVVQFVG
ncbi:MAG: hypothetical protein JKY84_00750 [Emcibacteraceae bacterium]|nr:hypothetical protein [Emcibacteraceae bacterium]